MGERPNFLVSAAARGDQLLCVAEPLPDGGCVLLIDGDTWHPEAVRMYRCTGTGPYVAWLGESDGNRVRLLRAHMAAARVQVRDG